MPNRVVAAPISTHHIGLSTQGKYTEWGVLFDVMQLELDAIILHLPSALDTGGKIV